MRRWRRWAWRAEASAYGCAGILTDGRLRDFDELAGYDFACYSSGEATRWGGDEVTPFLANVPVVVGKFMAVQSSYGGVATTPRCTTDASRPDKCGNRFETMPAKGIHHVDLTVADVDNSLAFYHDLLGPLGWTEEVRYPSYRGTEEVVYLEIPGSRASFGLRPADGGEYRYYAVGVEHIAFEVDTREEVDAAHDRCLARGANVHFPPEEDRDIEGYYALFVFDPDGIRVEVFCWPRADS
jgi:glyoxylase I family protein